MSTTDKALVFDPVGVVVDVIAATDAVLDSGVAAAVVQAVAPGRAKRRRLAVALTNDPTILSHGKSPAPRMVGDLLTALRAAGATQISAPRCAGCGKDLRTFQRRGQDWFCTSCAARPEPCTSCGQLRPVTFRDRDGRPRCGQCPDTDGITDPLAAIQDTVAAVDPDLDPAVVVAAVHTVASRPAHQRKLARVIADRPELLTGAGHLAPVPSVLRLIDALCDGGATRIVRPACGRCHRMVRLQKPYEGKRVCRRCIAAIRAEPCSRCGTVREPATRDGQGQPVCPHCLTMDPDNHEECVRCGRRRPVSIRATDGPVCPNCRQLPIMTCTICGLAAPCEVSRATGTPWCKACQQRWQRCAGCGEVKPVRGGTRDAPLCAVCTRPEPGFWKQCPTCGVADRFTDDQCTRCVLDEHLHRLLTSPDGVIRAELDLLREALRGSERPDNTLHWLAKSQARDLLTQFAAGTRPVTHEALDELGADKTTRHLRTVLVAASVLPARDEHLARLEQSLDSMICAVEDATDRHLLTRYTIWHHLRRLRARAGMTGVTYGQTVNIQQLARAAVKFLKLVTTHELTLATCQQQHLDQWLANDQISLRDETGAFIRWATTNKLTQLDFPATRWQGPVGPIDADQRWHIARTLLHDNTLGTADRVAGLLVVLYAQHVTDVACLRIDDVAITSDRVELSLGRVPVVLPEPLDRLTTTLVAARRGHAVTGDVTPSTWLFPGGQPGQPISAYQLRQRLAALGVTASDLRTAALFQLAAELPAAILARTLGIHITVAVAWQRAAGGDWTNYAADISRRSSKGHRDSQSRQP